MTAYGIDTFPLLPRQHGEINLGWGYTLILVMLFLLLIALLAVLGLGALYIHYMVLRDIYYKPSFSTTASAWVSLPLMHVSPIAS